MAPARATLSADGIGEPAGLVGALALMIAGDLAHGQRRWRRLRVADAHPRIALNRTCRGYLGESD